MHLIPDPTGSIHDALQIENAARNFVVSEPFRLWRALTTNRSNRVFTTCLHEGIVRNADIFHENLWILMLRCLSNNSRRDVVIKSDRTKRLPSAMTGRILDLKFQRNT